MKSKFASKNSDAKTSLMLEDIKSALALTLEKRVDKAVKERLKEDPKLVLEDVRWEILSSLKIRVVKVTDELLKTYKDLVVANARDMAPNQPPEITAAHKLKILKGEFVSTLERLIYEVAKEQQAGFDHLSKQLFTFVGEISLVEEQQRRLSSPLFEEMKQREETIKDAHKTTLDWMFVKDEFKFMEWLESGAGIFWVKGSGKSTLMKHICNHETTLETLGRWAGTEQLFTARFFFWNSGYPMQKSQVGLLQSLLYQVLRACPALIMEICPSKLIGEPWKRKELLEALDKVSKLSTLPAKFCFFVDGLDEYEGDDEDVIALLQDLTSRPAIKICVSSRPWNLFIDAFDDWQWKLVLEDLTRDDMRTYVHTMLVQNKWFTQMSILDPCCETLVPQIAQRAQGVWLWVYLVVRDLLRDLKGEEAFPLLQRRLDSFPDELEKYFENIIDRIDRIYREETSRIFLVAITSVQPFPLLYLHCLNMEMANENYALEMKTLSPISSREAQALQRKWKKLLFSRCRDLLEASPESPRDGVHILNCKVDFLHRRVRDFLRNNYLDELRKRAGQRFDARSALCKMIVVLSKVSAGGTNKMSPDHGAERGPLQSWSAAASGPRLGSTIDCTVINFSLVDELLLYAKDFERTENQSIASVLDELDRVNTVRTSGGHIHWTNKRTHTYEEYQSCTFLALTIQAGLRLYVNEKLEANNSLITQKRGRPLLDYACRPRRTSPLLAQLEVEDIFDVQTLRVLLEHGSDPNEIIDVKSDADTVWGSFILELYYQLFLPRRVKDAWYEGIELMIDHGASAEVRMSIANKKKQVRPVHTILEDIFGADLAARFASRMEEVAKRNRPPSSILQRALGWT
ncbi:hypothetical protein N431DRAFT_469190 [Stipitochalara longipes BDJ]|nr:hypothetical protein N431DRAFT_469190 [Stipitochalara longipes BDJ]